MNRLLLCLIFGASAVQGRNWRDVIDHSIYHQPQLDIERYQLKIELDPFFRVGDLASTDGLPSQQQDSDSWVDTTTASPTEYPTLTPTDSPSMTPTAPTSKPTTRVQNVEGNGGCEEGTVLYRVNMYDSWGDGWDSATSISITGVSDQDTVDVTGSTLTTTHTTQQGDTTVSISKAIELTSAHPFGTTVNSDSEKSNVNPLGLLFEGSLNEGSSGSAFVCLTPRRCYDVMTKGGDYLDEVSWDIEPVIIGSPNAVSLPVVQGGAPSECSFSIPDENGDLFCSPTCSSTISPQNSEISSSITKNMLPLESEPVVEAGRTFDLQNGYLNGDAVLDAIDGEA